jgi:hypothetical protein
MLSYKAVPLLYLAAALAAGTAAAQEERVSFRVAGWNMESGESDDALLRRQLGEKQGVHVWGLSEVRNAAALAEFEHGAEEGEGSDYAALLGSTGGADRLAIVYSTARFDLVDEEELFDIQPTSGQRAPLVAHLRGKQTGREFKFMVNHLARGNAGARLEQARRLNAWAGEQAVPVVAVGDYNFDYHVDFGDQGDRDAGFDALTRDATFVWARPELLVKTQADDAFVSVLDFVFVANPPPGWTGVSTILERDGDVAALATAVDFDDDARQTDHRPVDAVFSFAAAPDPDDTIGNDEDGDASFDRGGVRRRLDEIERSLRELRDLVGRN